VSTLFFSYSPADESLRDQLEKHLSSLQRQGIISSWHDRRIGAGTDLGEAIDSHFEAADTILPLISPDFISSDYCYEREMNRALEKHQKGEARVIPVILRPCDWHGLPFGKLLATPKDGRAITMWPNIDEAFLDVVTAIKRKHLSPRERGQFGHGARRRFEKCSAMNGTAASSFGTALGRSGTLRLGARPAVLAPNLIGCVLRFLSGESLARRSGKGCNARSVSLESGSVHI
jgi:hypothetical protein